MERSLEVVKAKLTAAIAVLCTLVASCSQSYEWESYVMDSHRTGVKVPSSSNVCEALGTIVDGVYTAPNGKVFNGGATAAVASELIAVQPQMAQLKKVICHAPRGLEKKKPESELTNFLVDNVMDEVQTLCKRKVDVGILNFGGVRTDISRGDVLKDDIVGMLPFRNKVCYVALKGRDLLEVFDFFAREGVQIVGGVHFESVDGKITCLTVGGRDVDPEKTYGLATIDFLLDGGDKLFLAKNARELIITDRLLVDCILPRLEKMGLEGEEFEYHLDGRVSQKKMGNR